MSDVFGPNVSPRKIEEAAEATIKAFLPDYLAEFERENGLDPQTMEVFKEYTYVNEFRNWAAEDTPVCVIISPGLAEPPAQKGDGTFQGKYHLGVAAIVAANNRSNTTRMARAYGAVLRQLILQQQTLSGVASGVEWEDEKFDDVPEDRDEAISSGQQIFKVEVRNIVNRRLGIVQPSDDPYDLNTEHQTPDPETGGGGVHITVEPKDEVEA